MGNSWICWEGDWFLRIERRWGVIIPSGGSQGQSLATLRTKNKVSVDRYTLNIDIYWPIFAVSNRGVHIGNAWDSSRIDVRKKKKWELQYGGSPKIAKGLVKIISTKNRR